MTFLHIAESFAMLFTVQCTDRTAK